MSAFSKQSFSYANYALSRPSYPPVLYQTILNYHKGPRDRALDLGTGHGLVARSLSPFFAEVLGSDVSSGMLSQARSLTPSSQYPNVTFHESAAESLSFIPTSSVDLVTAGQAAHWFNYPKLWPEMSRIVRPGGTVAFWGYDNLVFVDHANATEMLRKFAYGMSADPKDNETGRFWQQPGADIAHNLYRDIPVPEEEWEVERKIYEPSLTGEGKHKGNGECFMEARMTLQGVMAAIRSWSSFHWWQEENPVAKSRSEGGKGDCVDALFDKIAKEEGEEWKDGKTEVNVETGTGLILARKR